MENNYCATVEEEIIGTKKASLLLGFSSQHLLKLLAAGRVKGARKNGRFWEIPVFEDEIPCLLYTSDAADD